MCYAIPAKILSMKGDQATVDYGGVEKSINYTLVDDLEEGDYVLIHAGFAIEKLDRTSALESIKTIRNYVEWGKKN